jgi:uncharacterized protein
MGMKEKISEDLKASMMARDEQRTGALRLLRAELLKAEKEKGLAVDDARAMAILQSMLKQRLDSIEQFESAGRQEMADQEKAEMTVIKSYLPEPLSEDEIMAIIDAVLNEAGTPDPKQLGKLIGQVMGQLKATGRPFDGKLVNDRVRARLGA